MKKFTREKSESLNLLSDHQSTMSFQMGFYFKPFAFKNFLASMNKIE